MAETPKDWVTLQPNLDPIMAIPNAIIDTIDSVLSFLVTILNIVNVILNIVKVFLVGLLDPIRSIVEAIIDEVRAFIRDLRQLGVYLTGDWDLITVKPLRAPELLGGFAQYERRMLKRLLNRRDPGRPDFSSRSAAIALFTYLSTGDIFALIALINRIKAFFGDHSATGTAPFPAPTPPTATLGAFGVSTALFKGPAKLGEAPDSVCLTWSMPGTGSLFTAPPAGFLIHVSTTPNGFGLLSFKNVATGGPNDVAVPNYVPGVGIDAATGCELRLFGGISDLSTGTTSYDDVEKDSAQGHRLLLSLDANTPLIKPSLLVPTAPNPPMGAATYFMKLSPVSKAFPMSSYSATLQYENLPQTISVVSDGSTSEGVPKAKVEAEDCYTFYARIRPVTEAYMELLGIDANGANPELVTGTHLRLANWSKEQIEANAKKTLFMPNPGPPGSNPTTTVGEVGPASAPAVFSMPSGAMMDFITATETALNILLLVRADYTQVLSQEVDGETVIQPGGSTYSDGYETGLEALKDLLTLMLGKGDIYGGQGSPTKFRRQVRAKSAKLMDSMFMMPPPESIAEALAEEVDILVKFKWSDVNSQYPDQTIIESIKDMNPYYGVAASPVGTKLPNMMRRLKNGATTDDLWPSREGIFPQAFTASGKTFSELAEIFNYPDGAWMQGFGYSDFSPVIYKVPDGTASPTYPLYMQFVRRVLLEHEEGLLLKNAATILSVASASNARSPTASSWKTIRLLDEALAPLDKMLVEIEQFLLAILDGLQGAIDKIIAYIEAIQARIYQIQALIEMIRALLNSLKMFDLPSFSGLLLVENGTDGITKGLVTAGNKPSDTPMSYGGGVLMIAGGLPTIILEIIELILGGGAEESE